MVDLCRTFVKNRVFFGRPKVTDYISNSGLGEIKRVLLNGPPFLGDEIHLHFGSEVHKRFLLYKKSKFKFTAEQEADINGMIEALDKDPFVSRIVSSAVFEKEYIRKVEGVNVKVILDIKGVKKNRGIGADLKTTSCSTHQAFVKSALEKYDYLRQGKLYKEAEKLDDFYFIGIQKRKPYRVFIMDVSDYAKEEAAAWEEAKFLIEFFRMFGRPFVEGSSNSKRTKRRTRT